MFKPLTNKEFLASILEDFKTRKSYLPATYNFNHPAPVIQAILIYAFHQLNNIYSGYIQQNWS